VATGEDRKMKEILIVDDDPMLLTILEESLKRHKDRFEIITAKDGLAAIKLLQKKPFALVVTDLHMPNINGLVLLAYLNKNYPQIPCIVMTAFGTPFLKKRLQQDTSHYIEKPFEIEELAQAVISCLDQEDLSGTLNGISLVSFLKMIQMEYKTCLCEITGTDKQKGYFYFKRGVPFNAFCGKLKGEAAALHLLQMEAVTIKFRKPPRKAISKGINTELTALILEGARLLDEGQDLNYRRKEKEKLTRAQKEKREQQKVEDAIFEARKQAETLEKKLAHELKDRLE
jgi:CheY-like chemotaxis protein